MVDSKAGDDQGGGGGGSSSGGGTDFSSLQAGGATKTEEDEPVDNINAFEGDGIKVLETVARIRAPLKELWGICKALDAVVPRGVRMNFCVPEAIALRLLQQRERQTSDDRYFPLVKVFMGLKFVDFGTVMRRCVTTAAGDEEAENSKVLRALMMLTTRLQELRFDDWYSGSVVFPRGGVEKVIFGREFDRPIKKLPAGVKEVQWGDRFNKKVSLPDGLEKVSFGARFNQPLSLPTGLQILDFSSSSEYNQPVQLPAGIREVTFGAAFNQPLQNLPNTLEILRFSHEGRFNHSLVLPDSIREVDFGYRFNFPVVIPSNVRKLIFGASFDQVLSDLPTGLEELTFGTHFDQWIHLPAGLKKLRFGEMFDQLVDLPAGLETVEFSDEFNQPIDLPAGIKVVKFGNDFNQPLHHLPAGIEQIEFGLKFNQKLHDLPVGLLRLTFGQNFDQPLNIPEGVLAVTFAGRGAPRNTIEFPKGETWIKRIQRSQIHASLNYDYDDYWTGYYTYYERQQQQQQQQQPHYEDGVTHRGGEVGGAIAAKDQLGTAMVSEEVEGSSSSYYSGDGSSKIIMLSANGLSLPSDCCPAGILMRDSSDLA